jgi:hypothetical protein
MTQRDRWHVASMLFRQRAQGVSCMGKSIMKKLICATSVVLLALMCNAASAAGLSRVIIIQTTNLTAYLHEIDTLRTQYKSAGLPITIRVARARYAGAEAGTIAVVIDMPDFAALSKLDDLQKSNAGIAATMDRLGKIRKITSDSLYEVLSP